MFDVARSNTIDIDEFALVMEFLGLELSEQRLERLFDKFNRVRCAAVSHKVHCTGRDRTGTHDSCRVGVTK